MRLAIASGFSGRGLRGEFLQFEAIPARMMPALKSTGARAGSDSTDCSKTFFSRGRRCESPQLKIDHLYRKAASRCACLGVRRATECLVRRCDLF